MAVGRARQNGIEVPGLGIMSGGRFEEHAGSKLHRPNQHTLAPCGKSLQVRHAACTYFDVTGAAVPQLSRLFLSAQNAQACTQSIHTLLHLPGLQDIMTGSFTDDAPGTPAAVPVHSDPLLEDPNDDFCRVCGFGVSLIMIKYRHLPPMQAFPSTHEWSCYQILACLMLKSLPAATTAVCSDLKMKLGVLTLQGDMLCCETCPATFHKECIGLETTPEGDWWCPLCVCAVCGQAHFQTQALPANTKQVCFPP